MTKVATQIKRNISLSFLIYNLLHYYNGGGKVTQWDFCVWRRKWSDAGRFTLTEQNLSPYANGNLLLKNVLVYAIIQSSN